MKPSKGGFSKTSLLLCALGLSFLAGCATPLTDEEKAKLVMDFAVLSEEDIRTQIIGHTMTGPSKKYGKDWVEYYDPSGTARGKWTDNSSSWKGRWRVDGPMMCWDYEGTEDDGCWMLKLEGNQVTFLKRNGSVDGEPATLSTGNPQNL